MFKWKVSGLGGGSKKSKNSSSPDGATKLNNGQSTKEQNEGNKNAKNSFQNGKQDKKQKDNEASEEINGGDKSTPTSPNPAQKAFRLFGGSGQSANGSGTKAEGQPVVPGQQPNGILKNYDKDAMSRVGQRLAMTNFNPPAYSPNNNNNNVDRLRGNLSAEQNFNDVMNHAPISGKNFSAQQAPPLPPAKPGWRSHNNIDNDEDEEAIPSDSLYGNNNNSNGNNSQESKTMGSLSWREKQFGSRPSLNGLAHWSSHGYLARGSDGAANRQDDDDPGYVLLQRQGEQVLQSRQPQSLPVGSQDGGDRKYFSVRGFGDMNAKHNGEGDNSAAAAAAAKYLSVDARYNSMKNLPPDLRMKLRENLKLVQEQQQQQLLMQQQQRQVGPYQTPPVPPSYPYPPAPPPRPAGMKPVPPPRHDQAAQAAPPPVVPTAAKTSASNLESSKAMSNSVSWLEWTQQLQAYIAWVNSQLRKRAELRQVQDLRTDLQSGEVLAQLIEIISGEKIAGIEYNPESLQGMRDNLDRVLQFMAAKRIRMHHITSKEILEGNLKAVMRLILALAAHYKPQSVRHHDVSTDNLLAGDKQQQQPQPQQPQQQQQQFNRATGVQQQPNNKSDAQTDPMKSTSSLLAKENSIDSTSSLLNRTQDSARSVHTTQSIVKRSPSLNETHYTPMTSFRSKSNIIDNKKDVDNDNVYENVKSGTRITSSTMTQSTEKTAMSTQTETSTTAGQIKPVLQKEGSFVRTGSGRKLPKIPDRSKTQTLPTNATLRNDFVDVDDLNSTNCIDKSENRKSRPKALEFWETLETVDTNDFRYNTIHRMSMGRRMLPKPPPSNGAGSADGQPNSVHHARSMSLDRTYHSEADKESLNSSFSETESKLRKDSSEHGSVPPSPRPGVHKKIPPDGCSLQSSSSSGGAPASQPSPPSSSDTRGEVEGSSDNNSPPTSVIQGSDPTNDSWDKGSSRNPAFDWIRGAYKPKGFNADEESAYHRAQRKLAGGDLDIGGGDGSIPYEILLQDLTQAKRQLLELHNLECANLQGSKIGLENRLAEQESNLGNLKAELVRTTLAKQSLELEKKELLRRIDDLERTVKLESVEKDKIIRAHKQQMDETSRRSNHNASSSSIDTELLKTMYEEELSVAKDAISNLRSSFRDADPNQHILDTLEQCISVIIEKIQRLDHDRPSSSRMSSLDYNRTNDGLAISQQPQVTKILYFTNRSVTPFMSTISKRIGEINLRDFKNLFDRPGFYRFHFKSVDQEFGMVKEEISNDDSVLPGSDGKIVAWVEED